MSNHFGVITGLLSVLFCCATVTAQSPDTNNPTDIDTLSAPSATLSDEEMHYVTLECEAFAKEDNIDAEQLPLYIQTCVEELGAAVKQAMNNLESPPKTAATNENQTNIVNN